jgi:uncharacterized protein YqeY
MLIDTLRKDWMQVMKDKDSAKKDILGALIAECTKAIKQPNDASVIAVIKKMHQNAHDNWARMSGTDDKRMGPYMREEAILSDYIPSQLTGDDIDQQVRYAVNLGASNIGGVMRYFENNFTGRYDGRKVSEAAKRLLRG